MSELAEGLWVLGGKMSDVCLLFLRQTATLQAGGVIKHEYRGVELTQLCYRDRKSKKYFTGKWRRI